MKPRLSPIRNLMMLGGALGLIALPLRAAITVDGTLDSGYGGALAVQKVQTQFGDSTAGDGTSSGGSELDAAYGTVQGGNLYLFLAGNLENNGNHVNLFIADGRPGQNTLAAPTGNTMGPAMNGSVFSPGFNATYALDLNDYQGTVYAEEYNLVGTPSGGYAGSLTLTAGIGSGVPSGGDFTPVATIGFNNLNAGGIAGGLGAADSGAAQSVNTGLEVAIPLSALGNPAGNILVMADINGGGDNYLANQFLPGLSAGTDNVGGGGPYSGAAAGQFNFGSTPGQYFAVVVPEPGGLALLGVFGLLGWILRRKPASV